MHYRSATNMPTSLLVLTATTVPTSFTVKSDNVWTIVVLMLVLTLLPAILLAMTPFVRLLVVFHFLRQALGTQSTPSNQTLIGLALILTFFLMQPVMATIYDTAVVPLE